MSCVLKWTDCVRFLPIALMLFGISSVSAEDAVKELEVEASSQAYGQWAELAVDGDPQTAWRSAFWHRNEARPPHELKLTFTEPVTASKATVLCDTALGHGMVKEYELQLDNDVVAKGTNDGSETIAIAFDEREFTQLTFRVLSEANNLPWASVAEIQLDGLDGFAIAAPSEKELAAREDQRLRGRIPPKDDRTIELLDLALRTYDMLADEGADVVPFTKPLEKMVDAFANGQDDDSFRTEIKTFRREMIMSHPGLGFDKLLVNKHPTPGYHHQCDQYLGRHSYPGVGICVLENWKTDPACTPILEGKLPVGEMRHMDLSYDGEKLLFGYCDHTEQVRDHRQFFIYECDVDGSNVRQLTGTAADDFAGWENRSTVVPEDFDPCYLPNGDIAFISTRSQTFGRCHGSRYTPTYLVYRMNADGGDIRQISYGEANEWDPSVLPNGRLVYTRWDYINRHDVKFQSLWTMQPDGTGVEHYHGNYSPAPCMQAECRAIEGTPKTVFTATAHHSYTAGSILTCDPRKGEDGWAPLGRITPEAECPECSDPYVDGRTCVYSNPWPITENLYLAARLPYKQMWQGNRGEGDFDWAIYLVDSLGGRELIYSDPNGPVFEPIPLQPRFKPPMPASRLDLASDQGEGTFFVQNVYDCRQPIEPGAAKYMRINKIHGQPTRSKPWLSTANNEIIKEVVGYVPINEDGSVAFNAPSDAPLQLQVCDENGMAVMTMRSFIFLHDGEQASCTGCHEPRESTPARMMSGPITIHDPSPAAGPQYEGGFSYLKTVQPVLDRYCIGCHGLNDNPPEGVTLLGTNRGGNGCDSFKSLIPHVTVAYRNRETAYSTPKEYYAHAGELTQHLLGERHQKNCSPDAASMRRLLDWMDLNAQYFGDYSRNRVEDRRFDDTGVKALREAIAARFGDELAQQPIEALVNAALPSESRILNAPLAENAGGWGQDKNGWASKDDASYAKFAALVDECIIPQQDFDIRGTCGRLGCNCGCCFVRQLDERRLYPPTDRGFARDSGDRSPEGTVELDRANWKIVRVDSEETGPADLTAAKAIDGDEQTFWCTEFDKANPLPPHEIVIDLGASVDLRGVRMLSRNGVGDVRDCEIYVSDDANQLGQPVAQVKLERGRRAVHFEAKRGRYLAIRALSSHDDGLYTAIREIWADADVQEQTVAK